MRTLKIALVTCALMLAACNGGDDAPAVRSTTSTPDGAVSTTTVAPGSTPVIGQFCDNIKAGQEGTAADGKKVRCEYNEGSKRNQWVEVKEPTTTTTAPPATEPPPPPTTVPPEPGSADDPFGPILCPGLRHPAHHKPCPAKTTATTTLPRTQSVAAPQPIASSQPASSGTGACGGDLPPCSVMMKESGGDPTAVSPKGYCDGGDGRCHGKWQFDLDTWESLGYSGLPENHSEATQDQAARELLARSGCGQWSTC